MIKPCNYIEIEDACNYPFVSTTEIMTILGGVSKGKADSFRKELEKELDLEKSNIEISSEIDEKEKINLLAKCFYFKDTRPHKIPIKKVLEKAHIDLDYVRREANKMRKAKLFEKEV